MFLQSRCASCEITCTSLFWVAIAIAVAIFFATTSPAFDRNESLALFLGSCVLIVVAILWYRWRRRQCAWRY
jgi:hypothetical protein